MIRSKFINEVKMMLETSDKITKKRDILVIDYGKFEGYQATIEVKYDLFNHVQIDLKGELSEKGMKDTLKSATVSKIFNRKEYKELQEILKGYGIEVD